MITICMIFHACTQGFSLRDSISTSTVQEKWLYIKKGFFTEFSALLEELTVTSRQFHLWGDLNFHFDDNSMQTLNNSTNFLLQDNLPAAIVIACC